MKISKETSSFLKQLKDNNNREWFNLHKAEYESARAEFIHFSQTILDGIAKIDPTVAPNHPISDCIFRIYRDIRFSKDKTPYKSFFSAAFSSLGKRTQVPGYYLQIEPGRSFIIMGIWQPDKDQIRAIRQEIDYNGDTIHAILEDSHFKKHLYLSQEDRLKTSPKGYEVTHPDIDLLRLKSFMAVRDLSDEEIHAQHASELILNACADAGPFLNFLYTALEDIKP